MSQTIKANRRFTKTEKVFFRITPELKKELIKKSVALGTSLSEYMRAILEADLRS